MRRIGFVIGLVGLWTLSLSIAGGPVRGESAGARRREGGGCVYFVVRDSVTGKPLRSADCVAVSLRKGGWTDSLGGCLLCGLPPGRVVLTTHSGSYAIRRDTAFVRTDRTDTLRVLLAFRPLPPGTVRDTSAKYVSH